MIPLLEKKKPEKSLGNHHPIRNGAEYKNQYPIPRRFRIYKDKEGTRRLCRIGKVYKVSPATK